MGFKLRISDLALVDIDQAVAYYADEASASVAAKWLDGLAEVADSLLDMPLSFALAPESEDTGFEVRQVHYKSHRLLYTVEEETVVVLRIYHGARKRFGEGDLDGSNA